MELLWKWYEISLGYYRFTIDHILSKNPRTQKVPMLLGSEIASALISMRTAVPVVGFLKRINIDVTLTVNIDIKEANFITLKMHFKEFNKKLYEHEVLSWSSKMLYLEAYRLARFPKEYKIRFNMTFKWERLNFHPFLPVQKDILNWKYFVESFSHKVF